MRREGTRHVAQLDFVSNRYLAGPDVADVASLVLGEDLT